MAVPSRAADRGGWETRSAALGRSVPAANEAGLRCGHGTAGSVARIMGESREPLFVLHLQLIPLV